MIARPSLSIIILNSFTTGGQFLGQLKSQGKTLWINGLWIIWFPPASAISMDPDRHFSAAGPTNEKSGLFGHSIKE